MVCAAVPWFAPRGSFWGVIRDSSSGRRPATGASTASDIPRRRVCSTGTRLPVRHRNTGPGRGADGRHTRSISFNGRTENPAAVQEVERPVTAGVPSTEHFSRS